MSNCPKTLRKATSLLLVAGVLVISGSRPAVCGQPSESPTLDCCCCLAALASCEMPCCDNTVPIQEPIHPDQPRWDKGSDLASLDSEVCERPSGRVTVGDRSGVLLANVLQASLVAQCIRLQI